MGATADWAVGSLEVLLALIINNNNKHAHPDQLNSCTLLRALMVLRAYHFVLPSPSCVCPLAHLLVERAKVMAFFRSYTSKSSVSG